MVYSPGLVTVTLLSPASATLAADLGLTAGQNVAGAVLHLPQSDAEALVQAGVAEFGDDSAAPAGLPKLGAAQVPVSTVPVLLAAAGESVQIQAPAAAVLYVGGDDTVSAATGYPVAAGTSLPLGQFAGAEVWGVLASGADTAYVLRTDA